MKIGVDQRAFPRELRLGDHVCTLPVTGCIEQESLQKVRYIIRNFAFIPVLKEFFVFQAVVVLICNESKIRKIFHSHTAPYFLPGFVTLGMKPISAPSGPAYESSGDL